jgi:hypothetical protein
MTSSPRCACELPDDGCPRTPWNGSASIGSASSALGPPPALLLIGTRKGGTTALSERLLLHPHLLKPDCAHDRRLWPRRAASSMCVWDKEVRYFSRGLDLVDFCWYRRRYPCVPPGAPHISFDGSPDYLVLPSSTIELMARSLPPRAKLIALLRNPADRFYSAFNMGWSERRRNQARERTHASGNASAGGGAHGEHGPSRQRTELRRRRRLSHAAGDAAPGGGGWAGGAPGGWAGDPAGGLVAGSGRSLAGASGWAADGAAAARTREDTGGGAPYELLASSLDRWLQCAPECLEETNLVGMFFSYGMYVQHLRRFARHFGQPVTDGGAEGRLLVLQSEAFYADRARVVRQVWRFAGLAAVPQPDGGSRSNAGELWGGHAYLGHLRPAERAKLLAFYAPHNRELYAWLGTDFGWEASEAQGDGAG